MTTRKAIAVTLMFAMTAVTVPSLTAAPQANGILGGTAINEAQKPYTDYRVDLRDVATMQIVATKMLDAQGNFSFGTRTPAKKDKVELFNIKENKVVCEEGPYTLTASALTKSDVDINCGRNPAVYFITAAAVAAAAIALGVRSKSQ